MQLWCSMTKRVGTAAEGEVESEAEETEEVPELRPQPSDDEDEGNDADAFRVAKEGIAVFTFPAAPFPAAVVEKLQLW